MPRREARFPALKQHISKLIYLKQSFPIHTNLVLKLDEFGTWEVGGFQFRHIFKWILRLLNKPIFHADLIHINIYLIYININQILFLQRGLVQTPPLQV